MSEKASYARCPYCRRKLDKTPKRKTQCPHCDKPIYVRAGKLVREDALAAATTAKPAKQKPTAQKPAKPKPQGQLAVDLDKKKEKYSQKDLLAGLQLLIQIAGVLFASGGLGSLLGGLFGAGTNATRSEAGIANALQAIDPDQLLTAASDAYTSLDDEQQFQMRAVITWVLNGFQLPADASA